VHCAGSRNDVADEQVASGAYRRCFRAWSCWPSVNQVSTIHSGHPMRSRSPQRSNYHRVGSVND
jgi:hypothetical protein